jgi:hypothetical protein
MHRDRQNGMGRIPERWPRVTGLRTQREAVSRRSPAAGDRPARPARPCIAAADPIGAQQMFLDLAGAGLGQDLEADLHAAP